jgi:hypothetical protein
MTETTKLNKEQVQLNLSTDNDRYVFIGNRIYFKVRQRYGGIGEISVRYELGSFSGDKPIIRFDSSNPQQMLYANSLFARLREMGAEDVLNVPVSKNEISRIRNTAEKLEYIANVLEFQMRQKQNGRR